MSPKTPFEFTVLIPAKGECLYLNETLDSLSLSTIAPTEILIIDDGINLEYLKTFTSYVPNLNIRVLKNNGSGLVDALNTGIESASFEFIARLDSDDLVMPDRFSDQLRFLISNPRVVAVGTQVVYIDDVGAEIGHSNYPTGSLVEDSDFWQKCLLAHPSVMYRKSCVERVGKYRKIFINKNMDLAEDFDLWLRLATIGDLWNIDTRLLKYRQHANQISRRFTEPQIMASIFVASMNSGKETPEFKQDLMGILNLNGLENRRRIIQVILRNSGIFLLIEFLLNEGIYKDKQTGRIAHLYILIFSLKMYHLIRKVFSKFKTIF
jgi:glycosyltransferase involved in cell wall biosynthesis